MIADLLALGSALIFGASDFSGGIASRRAPATVVVVFAQAIGLALAAILAMALPGTPTGTTWTAGAIAGVSGSIGLVALYHGLATGRMAVVAPISSILGTGIPVIYGIVGGERPGLTSYVGFAVALLAIVAVSWTGAIRGSGIGEAIVAGVGFAGFFIALAATSESEGLWPLVPARIASISLVLMVLAVRRTRPSLPTNARGAVVAAGAGDMIANGLYLAAAQRGLLSSTVVLASLYPVFTVLLGRFVAKEHIAAVQWVGIVLAMTAVGLLAV